MSPANQVFATLELLEMILLHLPERDLILGQRVNTTWHNLTKSSPQLQRKLFYKADVCNVTPMSDIEWNWLYLNFKDLLHCVVPRPEVGTNDDKYSSWNKMFFCRPAVSEVRLELYYNKQVFRTVVNPNGVTFGDIRTQLFRPVLDPNGLTSGGIPTMDLFDKEVAAGRVGANEGTSILLWVYRKMAVRHMYSPCQLHQTDR